MYFARSPAFRNGFSLRPAPAIAPIMALHFWLSMRNLPDGNLIVTPSVPCANTTADEPADLISLPPSPAFFSILQTMVPSGTDSKDRMLPALADVPVPASIVLPTTVPSGAGTYEYLPS